MCEQDEKLCGRRLSLPVAFVSLTPVSDRWYPMRPVFCQDALAESVPIIATRNKFSEYKGTLPTLPYNQADPSLKTTTNSTEGIRREIGDPN